MNSAASAAPAAACAARLEPPRGTNPPPCGPPEAPTVRQATTWFTRRPDGLTGEESLRLKELRYGFPELADTAQHAREFAKIMARLDSERRLPGWIEAAEHAELPVIQSFARNLRHDLDAVVQGLTSPCNSGVVEGRVTDLKTVKRHMAGRAGFPLLRKRVLLVAASCRTPQVTTPMEP
ncbi:transposase [Streptomyces sp. BPTC-684]|uniref:transposase n=1 Tax=Streptomyces sp. BPTC-684 TaxID=3043734 RepID=UPI0024B14E98|nr:transposase [Streptomyces sp. BPTC-684]WHM40888.1 transposase [Streptomyces sp. BPTC-684]